MGEKDVVKIDTLYVSSFSGFLISLIGRVSWLTLTHR